MREDIIFCGIATNAEIVDYYYKQDSRIPLPKDKDMKRMVLQSTLMTSMLKTNEGIVGKSKFLVIVHEDINSMLFPFKDDSVMAVTFLKFEEIEELAKDVLDLAKTHL
ncbi:hypothetical protein [Nitrososphaera viennensis]|uniref:hypothetical protein n=1 Tax=Nitrososphaera viennensis TaxID=1034015 RepID=UPI001D117A02|nr:hypothetical protein [Nitrososphaera viennensis]